MRAVKLFVAFCLVLALAAGLFVAAAWRPAIAPVNPPNPAEFAAALVQHGADLAAVGNCDVCHTAPGGRPFAGGLAVPTPFGTIFSTNITPDAQTGIGTWSEAAFRRALRQGVRRDGRYLYPAFPYDHFTLVSDDDDRALYAFLMTRRPVHALAPADKLPFPLNVRLLMYGWNLLFLRQSRYSGDPAQSPTWNRGAYLAEGLGHCGACHTPRNFLGAEKRGQAFSGGEAEGWTAYALNAVAPAPVPWTADALTRYLQNGFDAEHGVARGPMAEVAEDLHTASPQDVRAIATYVAAMAAPRGRAESQSVPIAVAAQVKRGTAVAAQSGDSQANVAAAGAGGDEGAAIYAAACAGCHEGPRRMPYGGIDLALSSGITGPSARNLVNVVLYGLPAAGETRRPIMPGFAASLSDGKLVALARYLRAHFSGKAPWTNIGADVQAARNTQHLPNISPAPSNSAAPALPQGRAQNETQR